MRNQQEILNMPQAEGMAEPAMPPAASKALILEVNLNNSFHKIFLKVLNFQITIYYSNTQRNFIIHFRSYVVFELDTNSRNWQLDTSMRDGSIFM